MNIELEVSSFMKLWHCFFSIIYWHCHA